MYFLSTTQLIMLPRFLLPNCKRILRVQFLNDTLVHTELEVLNIGTLKMFKQNFKIFKSEVLKATSFKS